MSDTLFTPLTLGTLTLPNRIVMAPLTRNRATPDGDVPNPLIVEYYAQRATAGLIISEGTQISPEGKGYIQTPGIYSPRQVAGWTGPRRALRHHRPHEDVHARGLRRRLPAARPRNVRGRARGG